MPRLSQMDRVVKIWRVHEFKGKLNREDKPLFSSALVHRSSAASIVWYVSSFWTLLPIFSMASSGWPKTRSSHTVTIQHFLVIEWYGQQKSRQRMKNESPSWSGLGLLAGSSSYDGWGSIAFFHQGRQDIRIFKGDVYP